MTLKHWWVLGAEIRAQRFVGHLIYIPWVWPPPRIPVGHEGFGWDPLLKMVHNPGGHCYWEGATPIIYLFFFWSPPKNQYLAVFFLDVEVI